MAKQLGTPPVCIGWIEVIQSYYLLYEESLVDLETVIVSQNAPVTRVNRSGDKQRTDDHRKLPMISFSVRPNRLV